jgi:hypothetical protein
MSHKNFVMEFSSLIEFCDSKNLMLQDLMDVMSDLSIATVNNPDLQNNIMSFYATCTSHTWVADKLQRIFLKFTKGDVDVTEYLVTHMLIAVDTCLLTYFIVVPERQWIAPIDTALDRVSDVELLNMLFRQVVLNMICYNHLHFPMFSISQHFTPVRMVHPVEVVPEEVVDDSKVELQGPFGCNVHIRQENYNRRDDIIVDVSTLKIQKMFLALAMGSHDRLGADAPIKCLHSDILHIVRDHAIDLF